MRQSARDPPAAATMRGISGPNVYGKDALLAVSSMPITIDGTIGELGFSNAELRCFVEMNHTGTLDFIGCTRPCTADPFLPKEVEEGRIDDVHECTRYDICIATGAKWRHGGVNRQHVAPFPTENAMPTFTPDDIREGNPAMGEVVIHDDMGGVLAQLLTHSGCNLTIITPSADLSDRATNALEQHAVNKKLAKMGITLSRRLIEIGKAHAVQDCAYTGTTQRFARDAVVMVLSKYENNGDALPFRREITELALD